MRDGVGSLKFSLKTKLALLLALLIATGCSPRAQNFPSERQASGKEKPAGSEPRVVAVAAASDLQFALKEVMTAFHKEHGDIRIEPTFGSSGNFFAQLSNEAPFDLFLSADLEYPRLLVADGKASGESEFLYAIGHLVVWVPKASPLDVTSRGAETLLDESVQKVAIANPQHAPYGRAAVAALKSLNVYDQIESKLVLADNVAQAAQFVDTGAAEAGVFALSLALSPNLKDRGKYWEVPLDAHPLLEQGGVTLNWARDPEACRVFRDFLQGNAGRAILKRYGFLLPGE